MLVLYRGLATTAFMAGDFNDARSGWERLLKHCDYLIERPWQGFPLSSIRTVTDAESGWRWKLAALSELALVESVAGDITRAGELVDEADSLAARIDSRGPGVAWVSREIARVRTIADAAEVLFVTPGTVKKHLNSVYRKLDVRGRDEALLRGGYMGLLDAD